VAVTDSWAHWHAIAESEVRDTLRRLPAPLRDRAKELPVTCEPFPSEELEADGIEPDTLGLFVGETWAEQGSTTAPLPGQIILFLENLLDFVDGEESAFREEVRTTYLHELGHYLGLDEEELTERGLE
jgi:predicted Zn-dependent protease with MMP-like domain